MSYIGGSMDGLMTKCGGICMVHELSILFCMTVLVIIDNRMGGWLASGRFIIREVGKRLV